jgi:hypothetical protein
MADDTDLPSVDEDLYAALMELNVSRSKLSKVASRLRLLDRRRRGSSLTGAQSQARTVTLGAIDNARAAIDHAMGALDDALRADDPPRR